MRHMFGFLILLLSGICFPSQQESLFSGSTVDTIAVDSMQSTYGVIDTAGTRSSSSADTLFNKPLLHESASSKKAGPVLIKRTYDFKSQVRWGVMMMLFIAVIFGTAQSWNP